MHPNFPENLDIKPLHVPTQLTDAFSAHHTQKSDIQQYGIAGRVW